VPAADANRRRAALAKRGWRWPRPRGWPGATLTAPASSFLRRVSRRPATESSTDLVINSVANALGYTFDAQQEPADDSAQPSAWPSSDAADLRQLRAVAACGRLAGSQVVLAAPGVQLVVTSRKRLGAAHEWLYEVEGLAYAHRRTSVDQPLRAYPYPAATLFVTPCAASEGGLRSHHRDSRNWTHIHHDLPGAGRVAAEHRARSKLAAPAAVRRDLCAAAKTTCCHARRRHHRARMTGTAVCAPCWRPPGRCSRTPNEQACCGASLFPRGVSTLSGGRSLSSACRSGAARQPGRQILLEP
jgi:hypothetical protein